ncbi:MAG: tRNA lysidine(34) synthetase TilS [bacterium]|nr:tRNA lysidine(34) synthetase TilS [bacterium]
MDFKDRFLSFCLAHRLVLPGEKILVAVSGGIDSVVLLDCFIQVRPDLDLTLAVAHVNHGLRGASADEDERFVRSMAESWGIPFFREKADVSGFSASTGKSAEESARILRYRILGEMAGRMNFERIAVGHHADDQAETILLNLLRGTGIRGARGMRPLNGAVIRPLLFAGRQDIEKQASERNLAFREDATNLDTRFRRNRVRRKIMPGLKRQFGRGAVSTLCRFGESAGEAWDFIEQESARAFSQAVRPGPWGEIRLDILPFLHYFIVIRKGVISRIVRELTDGAAEPDAAAYERVLSLSERSRSGRKALLRGGIGVHRCGNQLIFLRTAAPAVRSVELRTGEWASLDGGTRIRVSVHEASVSPGMLKQENPLVEYFDAERVRHPLRLRYYRTGDRFSPLGMPASKKVKRFFIDEKIPNCLRGRIPILTDADGPIWIVGFRMDDRVRITPDTRHFLKAEADRGPAPPNQNS